MSVIMFCQDGWGLGVKWGIIYIFILILFDIKIGEFESNINYDHIIILQSILVITSVS